MQFVWIVLIISIAYPPRVDAYIDPSTGSYLFQVLIAGAITFFVSIKIYWVKIKTIIFKLISKLRKTNGESS